MVDNRTWTSLRRLLGGPAKAIAEIGVYMGNNAMRLRAEFPGAEMYLIDPWCPHTLIRTYEIDNTPEKWAKVEGYCRRRFARDPRTHLWKMASHEAVKQFRDGSLDLVFLDAGREYSLLMGYICAWLPKIRRGGVIAGKGLAGKMRGDVWLVLQDKFGEFRRVDRTTWAVKV